METNIPFAKKDPKECRKQPSTDSFRSRSTPEAGFWVNYDFIEHTFLGFPVHLP